ncbi:MAG: penicillin-binding transpeptidase domain-containing protein [Planctomycetota bacterium]|nr:penicillin-binding transpeptidase domain-containing protein [Planctomycetota bacterium]
MFHRRLCLLFIGIAGAGAVMAGQAYRLTVVQGPERLAEAESRLVTERWTPTTRGRVLDRKGRVIAKDEPSFDILVDYRVITEEWALTRATRDARRRDRAVWGSLSDAERTKRIDALLPGYRKAMDELWSDLARALGLPREELEERRAEIRGNVQQKAMAIYERWLKDRREEMSRGGGGEQVTLADVQRPLGLHAEPHAIARGVDEQTAFRIRRIAEVAPGIMVEPAGRREYPYESASVPIRMATFPKPLREAGGVGPAPAPEDGQTPQQQPEETPREIAVEGVATHILGWMRDLHAEDVHARPRRAPDGTVDRGFYQPGDLVGATGIEAGYERELRGLRGRRVRHLEIPEYEPGAEEIVEPVPGRDVTLTIDIALQSRVQALLSPQVGLAVVQPWHHPAVIPEGQPAPLPDGTVLNGAAVVYEIDSGEVLAMVTTPTFTRAELAASPSGIFEDQVNSPWVNRAIGKPYPPGSIVKPILLCGAVTDGAYSLARAIECTGHLIPDKPERYRCWVFKQHHTTHTAILGRSLQAAEAMAVSCNIFFYTLGRDLGPEGVKRWYAKFGVGEEFGLKIGNEYPGQAGDVPPTERYGLPHAILMGIGQGPVAWTPLHAAEAYAILARGGLHLTPRIVKDETPRAVDLKIDPEALDAALEGLRQSVNESFGTGHILRFPDGTSEPIFTPRPGIEVRGKTGTAEAPDIVVDRATMREGDHSWFVVLAGKKGGRPKYAISVVMEYAGSGGRVSGPICNQIIEALIAEGYL